jgi:diguanylate cyclase (GGDEF)-like protein
MAGAGMRTYRDRARTDAPAGAIVFPALWRRLRDSRKRKASPRKNRQEQPDMARGLAALAEATAASSRHDLLTALPNRALFQERLEQSLHTARRDGGKAAVIWIGLDRFKQINDTLGHAAGDKLLCKAAARLRQAAPGCEAVARMGGDEFAVTLGGIHSATDAAKAAAEIQNALALPFDLSGREVRISACCGIGVYPDHAADAGTLLRNASIALDQSKRAGRGAATMFDADFGDSTNRRRQIERDLPEAIRKNQLKLEYQPLVDRKGKVRAVEALLRWQHPELGNVSPGELIPIAEESGAIIGVGEWVLRRACSEGLQFLASGCVMSVNVSRKQLARPDFKNMVTRVLRETGFPAGRLELEVTETALMQDLETVIEQLQSLREQGVRFAMDDFGAGYTSLNLLLRLPVDCLKIDRSIVEMLDRESGFRALVKGLISVAHSLRLRVVAEGVETERQYRILQDMNCDLSQGFLLHRPMLPEAIMSTLRVQANAAVAELAAG